MQLPTDWSAGLPGKQVFEYANRVVLKKPNFDLVNMDGTHPWLVYSMQESFKDLFEKGELLLPNLHESESIAIFSDYGGKHPGSRYNTYSFLICMHGPKPFTDEMAALRKSHKMNTPFKEIKFKKLGHGPTARMLPEYLRLLDHLVIGGVFTLVVDKKIDTIFGPGKKETTGLLREALREVGLDYLKLPIAEKMLRIVHCMSYLTALLSREGQRIFWMTDNDAIAATPSKHKDTLALYDRLLRFYSKHDFELVGGATPFVDKSAEYLDLLSVPDIVGGAIESFMTGKKKMGDEHSVSAGVNTITEWLAHQGVSLKKYSIMLQAEDGEYRCGALNFKTFEPDKNAKYVGIDL